MPACSPNLVADINRLKRIQRLVWNSTCKTQRHRQTTRWKFSTRLTWPDDRPHIWLGQSVRHRKRDPRNIRVILSRHRTLPPNVSINAKHSIPAAELNETIDGDEGKGIPTPLIILTSARIARRLRADLITTFKIFKGLLDIDPNLFFLPPARRSPRGYT